MPKSNIKTRLPAFIFLACACLSGPPFWVADANAGQAIPRHLQIALRYENHRETGYNRSPAIDEWNRGAGVPLGSFYCAAFVSWCLKQANVRAPKINTAAARRLIVPGRSRAANDVLIGKYAPRPGDIVVWTRTGGGHTGFVIDWRGRSGTTIEANTSPGTGNQHNGDGVYRRVRSIQPFSAFRIVAFTPVEP